MSDQRFADSARLDAWCQRIGSAGYRGTATPAHDELIDWLEATLRDLGLEVRRDEFAVHRWLPAGGDLVDAGALSVGGHTVAVAGAVPYSRPASATAPVVYLAPGESITADNAAGRIVVRDFPRLPIPYDFLLDAAVEISADAEALRGEVWDRPGLADSVLHRDLLDAGTAGAAGMIIAFDLPREQVAGYHEPHKGTHYDIPAVFVGRDERRVLLDGHGLVATIEVAAETGPAVTANLHAVVPGRRAERAVLVSHTDGNTWVQENGIAALLGIAEALVATPLEERQRGVEFVFSTAHLHISREGAARYAATLDEAYDDGEITYVFPVEHLGVRAVEPVEDGPIGRRLSFSGAAELLLWCVGPSRAMRDAVRAAMGERDLGPVALLPGLGVADETRVPAFSSFGGLGTLFHVNLLPTMSMLTGPWTLWAPQFGCEAVDPALYRQHALAVFDVVRALDGVPRDAIAGDYLAHRRARRAGATVAVEYVPPEFATAPNAPSPVPDRAGAT